MNWMLPRLRRNGYWIMDARFWILHDRMTLVGWGFLILDIGFWILVA